MQYQNILGVLYLCFIMLGGSLQAENIVGFWKTIDDKTGKAQSVVAIYTYRNTHYGRIIATYDESGTHLEDTLTQAKKKAPGIEGNPTYVGVDLIWNLQPEGNKYVGKIADPLKGKAYDAELWEQKGKLIVRGKLLFFSRSQSWQPLLASDFPAHFPAPDVSTFIPAIPALKAPSNLSPRSST